MAQSGHGAERRVAPDPEGEVGVVAGAIASVMMAMPTGDLQARLVAQH